MSEAFVQDWIDSSPDRESMLVEDGAEAGVATATAGPITRGAVVLLGRPKLVSIKQKP